MKKNIFLTLMLLIIISIHNVSALDYPKEIPSLSAHSAILLDVKSGEILYEKNARVRMYPASTTKMLTAIIVLEQCKLDEIVKISFDSANTEGSSIYLQPGESFTIKELLYALLLESANDVAEALACHISGTVEEFGKLMTKRAKELGAKNSNFVNPHGLPDKNHYTTAYDLSKIALHAINVPKLIEITSTARYQLEPTELYPQTRYLKNSNRFLWGEGGRHKIEYLGQKVDIMYDAIKGIKTGFTKVAGNCFVSFAKVNSREVISVVLKTSGNNLYRDTRYLVDYGLYNYEIQNVCSRGDIIKQITIPNSKEKELNLIAKDSINILIKKGETKELVSSIHINKRLLAPIKKGDLLGFVAFTDNGKLIAKTGLVAAKSIEEIKLPYTLILGFIIVIVTVILKKWSKIKYQNIQ